MSKLEKLIQQFCPDGVEYVPLSSIGTIKRGNGLQKKDFVKSGIGCIHYGQIYTKFGLFTDKTLTYVDKELADHLLHIEKRDLVIACTSENIEDVCKAVAWLGDDSIVTGGHSCVLHHNQNPKYIAYFFQTESFQRQKRKYAYGTKVIDIKPDSIGKIEIPVPPLPVQEEIVRVLDAFTELQAELQAELQKRKQQYNFYRDNLLSFEGRTDVQWMKLGDVAYYVKNRITSSSITTSNYVSVENLLQDKQGKTIASNVPDGCLIHYEPGDVLIGNIRPYLKKIWLANGDGGTNGDVLTIRADRKFLSPEFLYQCLASDDFFQYDMNHAKGAKMPRGSKDDVMNYKIPITSLSEQQKIVDILDRFDALTNDLTSGLPAEMEKRRQQYEFYRDKLLTFKRKEA